MTYAVRFSRSAHRALAQELPEKVATAAWNFVMGALADNPHQVGKQLKEPLFPLYSARRGDYRVIYRILEESQLIEIVTIAHHRDSYRG